MKFCAIFLFAFLPFLVSAKDPVPASIYDFKVTALNGSTIDFSQFKGKKILVVNTTAIDYNSPQYAELEALSQKYKGKLVVVGFLISDFATPPGVRKDVSHLDAGNYKVTFPITTVVKVKGPDMAPVYKWLTDIQYNKLKSTGVKWDFQKYLINEKGQLVAEFDPKIRVTNPSVIKAIEQ